SRAPAACDLACDLLWSLFRAEARNPYDLPCCLAGSLRCSAVVWRKSHRPFNLAKPVAGLFPVTWFSFVSFVVRFLLLLFPVNLTWGSVPSLLLFLWPVAYCLWPMICSSFPVTYMYVQKYQNAL